VQAQQARGAPGDERDDELIEMLDLGIGNRARRPSFRSATRVA